MSDHFTLDLDPQQLRDAASYLKTLSEHLQTKGTTTKNTPGQIGDSWDTSAATSIKAEMTALGNHMTTFSGDLSTSEQALRSLATDYEDALDGLASLNTKWDQAQTDYENAVNQASQQRTNDLNGDGPMDSDRRDEIQNAYRKAEEEASDARQTTRHNLEYSFGMTRIWLAQQTKAAGTKLTDAVPLPVPQSAVDAWQANGTYPVRLDRTALSSLEVAAEHHERELRAEAQQQIESDLSDLNDAIESGDLDRINAALEAIGANADDSIYAEELVKKLGPDGVHEILDGVGRHIYSAYEAEEVASGIQAFSDTVMAGLAQYDDAAFGEFATQFMGQGEGPLRWALMVHSDYADGRANAMALAYSSEIFRASSVGIGWVDPYRMLISMAYGDEDLAQHFSENADATAFARVLATLDEDDREYVAFMLTFDGGMTPVSQEQWDAKTTLYANTVDALIATKEDDALAVLLEKVWPSNYAYAETLHQKLAPVLSDPQNFVYLSSIARTGDIDAKTILTAWEAAAGYIDADKLAQDLIALQNTTGYSDVRVAEDLGFLLGLGDMAGLEISLAPVAKSIIRSLLGAQTQVPIAGPLFGVLTALADEIAKKEAQQQEWSDGWDESRQHKMLAFLTYVQTHGTPPGYDQWYEAQGDRYEDDPEGAIMDYIQHLNDAEQGSQDADLYHEIYDLSEIVGDNRHPDK